MYGLLISWNGVLIVLAELPRTGTAVQTREHARMRSRVNDQVVCAMRVDEVLPLADYWRDPRFRAKRPGGAGPPDNFYRAGRGGSLMRVNNALHGAELATQDISGRHALVSWHFWYFGDQSPELPTELVHLVHSGQGHSLHANRRDDDLHTLLAWLARQSEFYTALGVPVPSAATALLLFVLTVPVFMFFATPVMSWWSRRHERQADDFAAAHADAGHLAAALVKLFRDNASTLTPDRMHSKFFDSHPPALERIGRLTAKAGRSGAP